MFVIRIEIQLVCNPFPSSCILFRHVKEQETVQAVHNVAATGANGFTSARPYLGGDEANALSYWFASKIAALLTYRMIVIIAKGVAAVSLP